VREARAIAVSGFFLGLKFFVGVGGMRGARSMGRL
jgi:hypothetical protein